MKTRILLLLKILCLTGESGGTALSRLFQTFLISPRSHPTSPKSPICSTFYVHLSKAYSNVTFSIPPSALTALSS